MTDVAADRPDPKLDHLRLVVFDCDGTLVDSLAGIVACMTRAFRDCRLPYPPERAVRQVIGLPLTEAIQALLDGQGVTGDAAALRACYRRASRAAIEAGDHAEPLFSGARETLNALENAGLLLGVATGKGRRGLLATLAAHGLETAFVTLQTADDAPGKPNPDMLLRAMAQAGAEPRETVMIGDTTFDIEMAVNAKVAPIGVSWGYHAIADLRAAGAGTVLDTYSEILPALEALR